MLRHSRNHIGFALLVLSFGLQSACSADDKATRRENQRSESSETPAPIGEALDLASTPAATSTCVIYLNDCPRLPSKALQFIEIPVPAASADTMCFTRAVNHRNWCGTVSPVTSKVVVNGVAGAVRTTLADGCHITLPDCPTDPTRAGEFYDYQEGVKTTKEQCGVRSRHLATWCRSYGTTSARYFQNGVQLQSWSQAGVPVPPEFAGELSAPAVTPILHQATYRHEADLFDYRPRYVPGHLGFSPKNEAMMLSPDGNLQILRRTGGWQVVDLRAQVTRGLADLGYQWNGIFAASSGEDFRVVFDNAGDAYVIFNTTAGTLTPRGSTAFVKKGLLLHSRDNGDTWRPYLLQDFTPSTSARLEFQDGNNVIAGPPPIVIDSGRSNQVNAATNRTFCSAEPCPDPHPGFRTLRLVVPTKNADGTLWIGDRDELDRTGRIVLRAKTSQVVATNTIMGGAHSGAGNAVVSVGNKVHVVYSAFNDRPANSGTPFPCAAGTPQYAVTYQRSGIGVTKVGATKFLGCGGDHDRSPTGARLPDYHNVPSITVDTSGYLHVVLGTHHDQFQYTKSVAPNDTTSWTTPVRIGEMRRNETNWQPDIDAAVGSYTYVALICDKKDMLHLVARWTGITYRSRLVYLRKSATSPVATTWDKFSDSYSDSFFPAVTRVPASTTPVLRAGQKYTHQHLVVPFQQGYTVYHHKLDVDRLGRLFLRYSTWEQQLTQATAATYCTKWPEDCAVDARGRRFISPDVTVPPQANCETGACFYQDSTKPKDPVILISIDGGNSWRVAQSQDFQGAVLPE